MPGAGGPRSGGKPEHRAIGPPGVAAPRADRVEATRSRDSSAGLPRECGGWAVRKTGVLQDQPRSYRADDAHVSRSPTQRLDDLHPHGRCRGRPEVRNIGDCNSPTRVEGATLADRALYHSKRSGATVLRTATSCPSRRPSGSRPESEWLSRCDVHRNRDIAGGSAQTSPTRRQRMCPTVLLGRGPMNPPGSRPFAAPSHSGLERRCLVSDTDPSRGDLPATGRTL